MKINILGWSYENIRRFGNITVDLLQENQTLPHIALIMMRNGTGKTTTIQLIRAILSGTASSWTSARVREFRPRDKDVSYGKFGLRVQFGTNLYYYILKLDYEQGVASYETSRVGNIGGLESERLLPTTLRGVFDVEEFVNRFIFDGEQAKKTLSSSSREAEDAIKYLYRVDKLDDLIRKIEELVKKKQDERARGQTQQSVRNNRTRMENAKRRYEELQQKHRTVSVKLEQLKSQQEQLKARCDELLMSDSRIRAEVEKEKVRQSERHSDLIGYFATIKARMREPYRVHPALKMMLDRLADNMQTLKLPKTTAREFFRELSQRTHCICGRNIGPNEKAKILENAEEYLGEEDLVAINAIKDKIRNYQTSDELQKALQDMVSAKEDLEEISGAIERLTLQLNQEAQREAEKIKRDLQQIEGQISEHEAVMVKLLAPADAPGATDQNNLAMAKRAYEDATANYNIALGTYEYTKKADILKQYLSQIRVGTLARLKQTIVEKTNERIQQIVKDEPIIVEKVGGSLVLQGRSGASEGQTLAIAYAYICSLFEHSAYDFPFVIDSPAASMDLDVRREVAEVIPQLFKQLIIFVTSGEIAGFAEKMYSYPDVSYFTIEGEHFGQPAKCTTGKEYFSTYQSEEEE